MTKQEDRLSEAYPVFPEFIFFAIISAMCTVSFC